MVLAWETLKIRVIYGFGRHRWANHRIQLLAGIARRAKNTVNSLISPNLDVVRERGEEGFLTVALLGPDVNRRQAVATAIAATSRAKIHEFPSYPARPGDLPSHLEQCFDIIILDLDSDTEFALQLVERIVAEEIAIVMVYSERADQNLVLRCMHAGVREYLLLPVEQGILPQAFDRTSNLLRPRIRPTKKTLGRLHVFLGAKGGAGVTTVCCNLALALAQESDQSTLLIDLALPIGDAALNLGLAAEHSTEDALRSTDRLDGNLLQKLLVKHRSGAFVLAAPSKVPELETTKEAVEKLIAVAQSEFDHVIVDVGTRTDLIGTTLFKDASTVFMVTQAGISELRNANRLISQFFNRGLPKLEVVVNRFEPRLLGGVNEEVISKALAKPVRWKIPDDQDGARKLQYNDDGLMTAETRISRISLEMACSITGRPLPPEKKKGFGFRDFGKSIMERTSTTDDPPSIISGFQTSAHITPTIAWSNPDPITYGEPLTIDQLNASASALGTLVYTPGPGYVLPVGTHTLWVTFIPANSTEESSLQAAVTIVVSKKRPVISWTAPLEMSYGTSLSAAQLNASASEPGTFSYFPGLGHVLPAGTHTLSATFTPTDTANYATEQVSEVVTVAKATPTIEWTTPQPITRGTVLGATQLNAATSVPGTFEYHPAAGEVLPAGIHTLAVLFTPTDISNYGTAEGNVSLTVVKEAPVIAWPPPGPLTYGALLSATELSATASVPGTFDYNPALGALLAVGEHTPSVVFTPTDSLNYSQTRAAARLRVVQAIPAIVWPQPDEISFGSPLSAIQLNATAAIPGSFAYTMAPGDIVPPGVHTITAEFTPTDSLNYATAEATVSLTVTEKSPVLITWPAPSPISYGTPLSGVQLNATASVEGTFVYTPSMGHVLAPGRYTLSVTFTAADAEKYGTAQAGVELTVESLPALLP